MKSKQDRYPIYTVRDLLEMEDDPEPWIVRHVIPKSGRILVYGTGGSYKSAVMFDLCVSVASGGMLMEQIPVETFGPVLVISTEGTVGSMRKRLLSHMRARNASPDVVQLFLGRKGLYLDKVDELQTFRRLIEMLQPILVVLDPYVSFLAANENDTEETKKLIRSLDEVIEDYNVAVAIIHHANKIGELRGSSVLQGWADTVLRFKAVRKQLVPGIQGKHDILTAEVEKQRGGPMGPAFSAVPFINERLGMISFGMYYGADAKMVTAMKLKHEVLELLRASRAAFTKSELAAHFNAGKEKTDIVLNWLRRDGLIQEVEVQKSTGQGRTRHVLAWASSSISSRVDASRAILRAERLLQDQEDAGFEESR